ncbi:hypothetical protein G6F22_013998 [Rhizopus arrhizus]|nr:hypothetical protein G6F22_013998 [Rhizopus arrhizus]
MSDELAKYWNAWLVRIVAAAGYGTLLVGPHGHHAGGVCVRGARHLAEPPVGTGTPEPPRRRCGHLRGFAAALPVARVARAGDRLLHHPAGSQPDRSHQRTALHGARHRADVAGHRRGQPADPAAERGAGQADPIVGRPAAALAAAGGARQRLRPGHPESSRLDHPHRRGAADPGCVARIRPVALAGFGRRRGGHQGRAEHRHRAADRGACLDRDRQHHRTPLEPTGRTGHAQRARAHPAGAVPQCRADRDRGDDADGAAVADRHRRGAADRRRRRGGPGHRLRRAEAGTGHHHRRLHPA